MPSSLESVRLNCYLRRWDMLFLMWPQVSFFYASLGRRQRPKVGHLRGVDVL